MSKTKFALGMSMVVALFAFITTPALARWTNHGGKGASKSGELTLSDEGATVKCTSASGIYKVNSEGTALTLGGMEWKECKPATFSCPNLELKQPEKEGTEKGKSKVGQISKECVWIIEGACEVKIPTEGNGELETTSMKKSGSNVVASVELKGITVTASSSCALVGIKEKNKSMSLKIPGLVAEGVGLE